jgi:hypothetical protein
MRPFAPAQHHAHDSSGLEPAVAAAFARLLALHDDRSGRPLLTPEGVEFVHQLLLACGAEVVPAVDRPLLLPWWDEDGRRLWLGTQLLKVFRQPAPHQTLLLAAFQEQCWSGHIDDPLPPEDGDLPDTAQARLRDAVKNLNRSLPAGTIRFRGDGSGKGVRWEFCTRTSRVGRGGTAACRRRKK